MIFQESFTNSSSIFLDEREKAEVVASIIAVEREMTEGIAEVFASIFEVERHSTEHLTSIFEVIYSALFKLNKTIINK